MAGAMLHTIRERRGAENLELRITDPATVAVKPLLHLSGAIISDFTSSLYTPLPSPVDKLEIINSDPRLKEYVGIFTRKLSAFFISIKAAYGGFVSPTESAFKLPTDDMVSKAINTAVSVHHRITSDNAVIKALRVSEKDENIEKAAIEICLAKKDLIDHVQLHESLVSRVLGIFQEKLATSAASTLAEHDADKLIAAIRSGKVNNRDDDFIEQAVRFVTHLTYESSFLSVVFGRVLTTDDDLENLPSDGYHARAGAGEDEATGLLGSTED